MKSVGDYGLSEISGIVEGTLYTHIATKCHEAGLYLDLYRIANFLKFVGLEDSSSWIFSIRDAQHDGGSTVNISLNIVEGKLEIKQGGLLPDGSWEYNRSYVPLADPLLLSKLSSKIYVLFGKRVNLED